MRHYSLVILLATLSILASCEPEPHELRLVAPISQVDRPIAEDLGRLLDNEYATRITLADSSMAGNAALDAVASGEADLALVANTQPFREDIATVMPLYSTILHIAYRDGRDASSGQTLLHDAKVYAGPEGSASQVLFARVVQRIGLDVASFEYVTDADTPPDVVVVFAPISQDLFTDYPDFRLFNLGPIVDVATLLNPHFRPIEIPAGTYGAATPENAVTLAVDKLLVTRNTLDSSVVYDLINDILRLRPALAAQRPGLFQQLTENFDASRSRFALHAGTQAYLQRSAPTV